MGHNNETGARPSQADSATIADRLQNQLGRSLVAFIVGVDEETVTAWSTRQSQPSPAAQFTLLTTGRVFSIVADADSPEVARTWFMGTNPELKDDSPAEALSERRFEEVIAAAHAYARTG